MANSPNPQVIREIMYDEFGTKTLITNRESDILLKKSEEEKKRREDEESQVLKRWCGGRNGFNVWIESFQDS